MLAREPLLFGRALDYAVVSRTAGAPWRTI